MEENKIFLKPCPMLYDPNFKCPNEISDCESTEDGCANCIKKYYSKEIK